MHLPKIFRPVHKTSFLRVGKNFDGGYIIPKKALLETKILLSFGLSDDWSFENEFHNLSKARVLCFDHSVNLEFWIKLIPRNLIDLFRSKIEVKKFFSDLFLYINYLKFFNGVRAKHIKNFVGSVNRKPENMNKNSVIGLKKIFEKFDLPSHGIFLKVDIEGNEYDILDQILECQSFLTGLIIEFHDCDQKLETIKKFISNFDLNLVHIHVNNFGALNSENIPTVFELTFSPKKFNLLRNQGEYIFPVQGLDQPNDKTKIDKSLNFF